MTTSFPSSSPSPTSSSSSFEGEETSMLFLLLLVVVVVVDFISRTTKGCTKSSFCTRQRRLSIILLLAFVVFEGGFMYIVDTSSPIREAEIDDSDLLLSLVLVITTELAKFTFFITNVRFAQITMQTIFRMKRPPEYKLI